MWHLYSGGEAVARGPHGRRCSDGSAAAFGRGQTAWAVTLALAWAAPDVRRPGLQGRGGKEVVDSGGFFTPIQTYSSVKILVPFTSSVNSSFRFGILSFLYFFQQ